MNFLIIRYWPWIYFENRDKIIGEVLEILESIIKRKGALLPQSDRAAEKIVEILVNVRA